MEPFARTCCSTHDLSTLAGCENRGLSPRGRGRPLVIVPEAVFSALVAHAAGTADAPDLHSSHAHDAPEKPGCADSRSADTVRQAPASPLPLAHRVASGVTGTSRSILPPTSAR